METLPVHLRLNPHFARAFRNTRENDLSEVIIIIGRTGFGKSCTGLFGMTSLDVALSIENNYGYKTRFTLDKCFFSARKAIEELTKQTPEKRQFYPKGTCFMFDEANVEASNLEFQKYKSKALVTALQTNRKYNYILFMTTPDWASIAIGLRRRITMTIELQGKTKKNGRKYAVAKVTWVDYNHRTGEPFFKYHRQWSPEIVDYDEHGQPVYIWRRRRIRKVFIPLVAKNIEEKYNVLKDQEMFNLREKIMKELEYYKKFVGESGRSIKPYTVKDLKNLFVKEDGSIKWELCAIKGKIYRSLVEDELEKFEDTITDTERRRVQQWLTLKLAEENEKKRKERHSGGEDKAENHIKRKKQQSTISPTST